MQSPVLGHPGSQGAALHLPHCLPPLPLSPPPSPPWGSILSPGPHSPLCARVSCLLRSHTSAVGLGEDKEPAEHVPCHPIAVFPPQCLEQPLSRWPQWCGGGRGAAAPPQVRPGVWWPLPSLHAAADLHFFWEVAVGAGTDAPPQRVARAAAPKPWGVLGPGVPPNPQLPTPLHA